MDRKSSKTIQAERRERTGHGGGRPTAGGDGPRRKPLPPEKTHAEEFYYLKQMNSRTPMIVVLDDGSELRGWIEWYDRDCIKLHRHDQPNLLINKRYVKLLHKDPAAGAE